MSSVFTCLANEVILKQPKAVATRERGKNGCCCKNFASSTLRHRKTTPQSPKSKDGSLVQYEKSNLPFCF